MSVQSLSITATSVCCALGDHRDAIAEELRRGRSGLAPLAGDAFDPPLPFSTYCGRLAAPLEALPAGLVQHDTRITRLAAALYEGVAETVAAACGRYGDARVGLFVGTSVAGIDRTELAYGRWLSEGALPATYDFDAQHAYHALLTVLRKLSGIRGPAAVISTACSSSGKAFASAQRALRAGLLDAALVGGLDVLCQTTLRGFHSLGVLSPEPCRPFCAERRGISIGEGGALFLLETALAEEAPLMLLGVGESSDAHHMSAPHPEGLGARLAMERALADAGLEASSVDHINAHGTATPLNDRAEAAAIGALFSDELPVLSTKAYTGHLLGGASAVEAAISAICLEEGLLPPALGLEPRDPEISISILEKGAQGCELEVALSNSFAFGGNNVSLLLGHGRGGREARA